MTPAKTALALLLTPEGGRDAVIPGFSKLILWSPLNLVSDQTEVNKRLFT